MADNMDLLDDELLNEQKSAEPDSLQKMTAKIVGTDPKLCLYKGVRLSDLPVRLLEEIIPWISASSLLSVDTTGLEERGFDQERLWRNLAEQRWLHKKPSQRNPFRIGLITWRQFYIDEHFKETLNFCSHQYLKYVPSLTDDPKRSFKAARRDVHLSRYEPSQDDFIDCSTVDDLRELAPHVRTLSISFKQLHFLDQFPDLLHALSHSVETLSLQNLATRGSLIPIRTILIYGRRLKYLDVMNCIWDDIMMSMITMMSGQMSAVDMSKLDADMSEEARRAEKEACTACHLCRMRKRTYQPYQVPNFLVENSTIHPISDLKFVRILRGWTELKEFIHMCYPLSTPKVEQETISPLLDALVFLARSRKLCRIQLNGPYHMSVVNLFTQVTAGEVERVNDITYNTLIHCHVGCHLRRREVNGTRKRNPPVKRAQPPGILSLELNSVHCDAVLRPVIFKPIVQIVANDDALRHLSMQSCRQFPDTLVVLFRTIAKSRRLVSLDLTGNYIQRSAFGDLISMIKTCDSLKVLIVDYCELPTRESYVQELAETVAKSNLTTLSVANNRLGEFAAQMVVEILKMRNGDSSRMHSINVSQNCIKFSAIELMCDHLIELRKEIPDSRPLVTNLSLDDILECGTDSLTHKLAQLSILNIVENVMSKNNLLLASRATLLGYVAQM